MSGHMNTFRRMVPLACAMIVALVCCSPSRADAPAASGAPSLVVGSINMEHKDRPHELKVLSDHLRSDLTRVPDFILCQEVVFKRDGRRDNTAAVLADYLGYHARGTKRTTDREGIAIISKYPFVHYEERHLKAQTARLLIGFRRVSIMGEFMVPGVGRVRVVDVHLTNWGFEHHIRRRQIQETLQWIADRQAQAPAAVTLFGGDFNAKHDWDEMKQIVQPETSAPVQFLDFNGAEPSQSTFGPPNKRIDYLFVSAPSYDVSFGGEQLLWKDGLRDGNSSFELSDHLFLLHTYRLANRPVVTAAQ